MHSGDASTLYGIFSKEITSIENDVVSSIREKAFYRCEKLSSALFSNVKVVKSSAFEKCLALVNANFPSVETCAYHSFYSSGIKKVNMPTLKAMERAFESCTSLESVDLTEVPTIGANAFKGCTALKTVIIRNQEFVSLTATSAFQNSNTKFIIYVLDDLVDSYKEGTNWSTYANRIKPLSELPAEEGA